MLTGTKTLTGSQIIIETLKSQGVDKIFGYPGGMVLKIYDELYNQKDIQHILVRHEQSAVHAAEGYARATGKVGVVLVTSGPGATNTVTGICNAYLDGFPLVVLTGQVNFDLIGKNAFQEADICEITKACTKKVYQVTDVKNLQKTLNEAFKVAQSGKKGPVVVDLAKNILYDKSEFENITENNEISTQNFDLSSVFEEFTKSKYPLIVVGGGTVSAYKEIRQAIKNTNIPIVNTMMATGVVLPDDKNYLGMVGIFGCNSANQALRQADLILSVGARLNDRITCCFDKNNCKLIQIDINQDEISKNIESYLSFIGDAKEIIPQIKFPNKEYCWDFEQLRALNSERKPKTNMLHSFELMRELNKFIKDKNLFVTTEVGQHQLWTVQNLEFSEPLKFMASGGLGTMGFGLPSAIGCAIADKSKPVVCIAGDGSFQMSMPELATCVDYNLPIKIFVMNNGYLGMVRQLQENQCESRYCETKISNPDFEMIAKSYGIQYNKINSKNDINSVLTDTFNNLETQIIECVIEPMEML